MVHNQKTIPSILLGTCRGQLTLTGKSKACILILRYPMGVGKIPMVIH
ncbi:hypothetical protein [Tepidanaerobacter acetatoxydans]|nr:hypothetical protein [Tepidanaerobacter acetatoxydans]